METDHRVKKLQWNKQGVLTEEEKMVTKYTHDSMLKSNSTPRPSTNTSDYWIVSYPFKWYEKIGIYFRYKIKPHITKDNVGWWATSVLTPFLLFVTAWYTAYPPNQKADKSETSQEQSPPTISTPLKLEPMDVDTHRVYNASYLNDTSYKDSLKVKRK